ncbi:pyridoxal phosphate-dependent transferase [Entophlyctis helioformis]|nr:pyridoxal phosphate-dependent transferase [Entophlyctis helioformis]
MSAYVDVEKWASQSDQEYERPPDPGFESQWLELFSSSAPPEFGEPLKAAHFPLLGGNDPDLPSAAALTFLAHGSYGATASPMLDTAHKWSLRIEANPVRFYYHVLFPYLARSARDAAAFVGASPQNIVLTANVEFGIGAVLSSLDLEPGDVLVAFDWTYEAVLFAMESAARSRGATVAKIPTTMPVTGDSVVQDLERFFASHDAQNVADQSRGRIRLASFEHITSPTALILPVEKLVKICRDRGILTLIDGAHAIGQLPLMLEEMRPDFYVTNPHKWLCNVRGCALLYVDPKHHKMVHPLLTTWGAGKGMHAEFVWQGTQDYSAQLSLATAISFFRWIGPEKIMSRNRALARRAGKMLAEVWATDLLTTDMDMFGCMVTVGVPDRFVNPASGDGACVDTCSFSDLHDDLIGQHGVEVPVFTFRKKRYVRVSIHMYNSWADACKLAEAVLKSLGYPPRMRQSLSVLPPGA